MASNCIDLNDQIYQSRQRIGNSPISNANGELNVYAIETYKAEFLEGIKEDGIFDPVGLQISQHGDEFFQALNDANRFLNESQLADYPELNDRVNAGPLSALEFADFCGGYHYNPPKLKSSVTNADKNLLRNLNSYYRDPNSSILGAFCAMMPQVFQQIDGFFTILGSVAGLINDAISMVAKIRNLEDPIKAIQEKITVVALINAIKEKVESIIDETFAQVEAAIEQFNVKDVVGEDDTKVDPKVHAKGAELKDAATAKLTEEKKKGLKEKVIGLFDYAVSLLSNPGLEEIQFLIARFCGFVANIEALIRDIKTPMDQYAFKYQRIVGRLKRLSNMATASAVAAGATRIDEETRKEEINRMEEQWAPPPQTPRADNAQDEVTSPEVSRPERLPDTYSGCSVEETQPTQHHTPSGRAPNNAPDMSPEDFGDIPTWSQIKDGNHPRIAFTSGMGEAGWTGINTDVKARLMRLQALTGAKLTLNSGFRSEQYQANLRRRYAAQGKSRGRYVEGRGWNYGVAFYSQHMQGNAVDVRYGNWNRSKFIDDAKRCGFKFIKTYNTFIHIDIVQR